MEEEPDLQWSKTKKTVERFLCERLQGRIELHATYYRKFHDQPARVSVTLDGIEILSAADTTFYTKQQKIYQHLSTELPPMPYDDNWTVMFNSPERHALVCANQEAEQMLVVAETFSSFHIYEPLMQYHTLSIEDALQSEHVFTQALAMFDRRLGKRKLLKITPQQLHPTVQHFYVIRCEAEGIHVRTNL